MIQLYMVLVNIPKYTPSSLEGDYIQDIMEDLNVLEKSVYGMLDPSIRIKLQNKGLTLLQNIYTGFDTEYYKKDGEYTNTLLSVQLAITTKTLLRLPRYTDYTIASLNPLNSEVYPEPSKGPLDRSLVDKLINDFINSSKSYKNKLLENSLIRLLEGLKNRKIPFIEQDNFYLFTFGGSVIKQWYKTTYSYTFKELVKVSNFISRPLLDEQASDIYKLLEIIYLDNKDDTLDLNTTDIITLPILEVDDDDVEGHKELEKTKSKPLPKYTRTLKTKFTGSPTNVTTYKTNYFIGHLTNADLSMLKDFPDIVDELDKVNGCLITLKKPILIDGVNVIIRDTMLLAPGSGKSLASIGKLYDGFEKIIIDSS